MDYGRRVAIFIGVMVIVGIVLVALFIVSAREAVDGAHWGIQMPELPAFNFQGLEALNSESSN